MLVPSGIHAKYPIPRNAESLRNPRFSRAFTSKITHSIPRRPKLVMSILPKLREQNDQIIAMWQEQNELLRKSLLEGDHQIKRT